MQPAPPFFVFDGDCGFCRKWASWLQRRLPPDTVFVPYQDLEDLGTYGLGTDDVTTASYWIDEQGRSHRGAASFAGALRQGGGSSALLGAVLSAPVARGAAKHIYAVVARNRHRLPAPDEPSR